mgnify:CR=1 FL=1
MIKEKPTSPIFSKLDYENAVEIKRSMLEMQMGLINSAKIMGDYKDLRQKEFVLKWKLKNDLKDANNLIKKINANWPKTTRTKEMEKMPKNKKNAEKIKINSDLEYQLKDIKRRLNELS